MAYQEGIEAIKTRLRSYLLRSAILLAGAQVVLAACSGHTSSPPSSAPEAAQATPRAPAGEIIARAQGSPVDPGELPACFVEDEAAPPPPGARTDVYGPVPRKPPAPPATPRPTPDIPRLLAESPFPLYALTMAVAEAAPGQLRVTSVARGGAREVILFDLTYRVTPPFGGGLLILLSAPSAGPLPPHEDLDDSLDATRLEARLEGLPATPDPLADPLAALTRLGCPRHQAARAAVQGTTYETDRITWPGAPRLVFLRLEAGPTELTVETGGLSTGVLDALPAKLSALNAGAPPLTTLTAIFGAAPPARAPAATARSTARPAVKPASSAAGSGH